MTDSCWFPQVTPGEYVLNILFGLERIWNRDIAFFILEWRGLERKSRTCSGCMSSAGHLFAGSCLVPRTHIDFKTRLGAQVLLLILEVLHDLANYTTLP